MSGPIIIRSNQPVLVDKTSGPIVIRPGQKVLVIDPVTHKKHYNKGSVELAFSTGVQNDLNYMTFPAGRYLKK